MPIPQLKKPPQEVTIQQLRELAAEHGQEIAVLMTWCREGDNTNLVTCGSDQLYSQLAAGVREKIEKALGLTGTKLTGDLRFEHVVQPPTEQNDQQVPRALIPLTHADLSFLLWLLGYINAEADKMDQKHKDFISRYHWKLLPLFGGYYERLGKLTPSSPESSS